jgi:hypothetical protein
VAPDRSRRPRPPWLAIGAGALLLSLATPPVWFAGGALLIVPGLMVLFALATGERRPLLASYLLGALHVLAFSWSLRHVTWVGWLLIGLLGGCYPLAAALLVRTAAGSLRAPLAVVAAFGVAIAGTMFLRAEMPGLLLTGASRRQRFQTWLNSARICRK